jgi:hypothetical protein
MPPDSLVFLPVLAGLVEQRGWQGATLSVSGASALVFAIVLIFHARDRPRTSVFSLRTGPLTAHDHAGAHLLRSTRSRWRSIAPFWVPRDVLHLRREHQRADPHPLIPAVMTSASRKSIGQLLA